LSFTIKNLTLQYQRIKGNDTTPATAWQNPIPLSGLRFFNT